MGPDHQLGVGSQGLEGWSGAWGSWLSAATDYPLRALHRLFPFGESHFPTCKMKEVSSHSLSLRCTRGHRKCIYYLFHCIKLQCIPLYQSQWLRATQVYYLRVLEVRSLK